MRAKPTITRNSHKISRLTGWFRLWVQWWAAVWRTWAALHGRTPRQELDRIARTAHALIYMHACMRIRMPPQRGHHRHGRKGRPSVRKRIGARLRHITHGRSAADRVFAILGLMRDFERHVARLAHRLARDLTRLRILDPERNDAPSLARAPCRAIACADTS